MPIYEYRCKKGHTFDVMQRFSDDALTKCEICGASAQRVMHAPAVHFKGSGFYNTDYGTKKRSRELKEQKESKSGEGGGASDKKTSDATPAASGSGSSSDSGSSGSSGSSSSTSDGGSKSATKAKTGD